MKMQMVTGIKRLRFPPQCQVFSQDERPPGCPCQQTYKELQKFHVGSPGQARAIARVPVSSWCRWAACQPGCTFPGGFPISGFPLLKANSKELLRQVKSWREEIWDVVLWIKPFVVMFDSVIVENLKLVWNGKSNLQEWSHLKLGKLSLCCLPGKILPKQAYCTMWPRLEFGVKIPPWTRILCWIWLSSLLSSVCVLIKGCFTALSMRSPSRGCKELFTTFKLLFAEKHDLKPRQKLAETWEPRKVPSWGRVRSAGPGGRFHAAKSSCGSGLKSWIL